MISYTTKKTISPKLTLITISQLVVISVQARQENLSELREKRKITKPTFQRFSKTLKKGTILQSLRFFFAKNKIKEEVVGGRCFFVHFHTSHPG